MAERRLNGSEEEIARQVFGTSLPYDQILVTDQLGMNDRKWTPTVPGLMRTTRVFYLNVGPGPFAGMQKDALHKPSWKSYQRDLLIHELTHVWQGYHGAVGPEYMLNSGFHQAVCSVNNALHGKDPSKDRDAASAYKYAVGKPWRTYAAEQQAQIVEDWYYDGMSETDPRFAYVRDHVRTKRAAGVAAKPARPMPRYRGPRPMAF